jgi:hypothetical protein
MVCDPSEAVTDESAFDKKDWTSSKFGHTQGKEELPPNMPKPQGQGFAIHAKVDADHAADSLTRPSRTGFVACLNSAPVCWFSKKQTSCASSSFGSEFVARFRIVAMKQCCEHLQGL